MSNATPTPTAARLLAGRRARVARLRRTCAAAVLSTFVLAFGVITADAPTSAEPAASAAAVVVAADPEVADAAVPLASTSADDAAELPAVTTAQS